MWVITTAEEARRVMHVGATEVSSHCSSHLSYKPWVRSPQGGIQLLDSLWTVGRRKSTAGAKELSVEATYDGKGGCWMCKKSLNPVTL